MTGDLILVYSGEVLIALYKFTYDANACCLKLRSSPWASTNLAARKLKRHLSSYYGCEIFN